MGTFPTGPTLVAKQRAVKTSFARKERERERRTRRARERKRKEQYGKAKNIYPE
jgi:hypothetical protein